MSAILVANTIFTRALSSRPSARLLEPAVMEAALVLGDSKLTFDLSGKLAMAPSFFDELIRIVAEKSGQPQNGITQIELVNVPSQPSSKFHAVCKSHRLSLSEPAPGHWIIARP